MSRNKNGTNEQNRPAKGGSERTTYMRYTDSTSTSDINKGFFNEASTHAAMAKLMLRKINTPAADALSERAEFLFREIVALAQGGKSSL